MQNYYAINMNAAVIAMASNITKINYYNFFKYYIKK